MKTFLILTLISNYMLSNEINPDIKSFLEERIAEFDQIPDDRKEGLKEISEYIKSNNQNQMVFICTHNSRRSHLAQIFAQVASDYYKVDGFTSFSGGTEGTAFNPRAVAALERIGFEIKNPGGDNPKYEVRWNSEMKPQICYSKVYDTQENPHQNFSAVMVCSSADAACPMVPGADMRFSIPYEDPKEADNTSAEASKYDERARQIAREMLYVFYLASKS